MGGSRFLKRSLQQSAPSLEVYRGGLVVSFARHGRSHVQSFPRKRESTPPAIGNAPPTDWIPAFAGMTSVSIGVPFQMAPAPAFRARRATGGGRMPTNRRSDSRFREVPVW